jgi:hypothetical protein
MLRRTRTTKKLAKRIDMQYFAQPHPLRRWRFWLSVAVPLLGMGWFVAQRAQGGQKVYSSGPLSHAHAVFTQQCALCHVTQAGAFSAQVTDRACLTCHDAPVHHANQTFTPACSSCHVEHKGSMLLQATSDAACTQCHADLRTRDGQPHFVTSIGAFDRRHPDIAAMRTGQSDPGGVRLNHFLHLQPNLMGPGNSRVQMACEDCHRTTRDAVDATKLLPAAVGATHKATSDPAYMPLPNFANHCASCHTLQFDKRFGENQVPHDKPEVVHTFLLKQFADYIARHPGAVHEVTPPLREIPERERIPLVARNAAEWVQFRVDDAEWLLYAKTCKQCHTLKATGGALPEIAKTNLTTRWLQHAEFDHHAHRMMTCTGCHTRTPDSRETSDVLLPGIQTCEQCHQPKGSSKEAAEGRCYECHQYHDWSKAKPTKGGFTIEQLRGSTR